MEKKLEQERAELREIGSVRSDQMFANVCSYAHCESVRQKVAAALIHKIVQRRQQIAAINCIEEVVFHW
jgi:hypothetical protein